MKPQPEAVLWQPLQTHLTDDEIDAVLLECASVQAQHHLAACDVCSGRVEEFRSSMELFNRASLAWSATRSNTLPSELPVQRSSRVFATPTGALGFMATLCVGVAVAITAGLHQRSGGLQATSYAAAQRTIDESGLPGAAAVGVRDYESAGESAREIAREIAQDNAMLREIHSELDRPEPSPFALDATSPADAGAPVRD